MDMEGEEMRAFPVGVRVCAAMLLAAVLSGGCGGGGSDGDGPTPSNDPTALSITSSRNTAFEGEGPIALTSSPGKGSRTTWTFSPPIGTLSSTSGDAITFTPPALYVLSADTVVKVSASSSGLTSAEISIPIYRSSLSIPTAPVSGNSTAGETAKLSLTATPTVPIAGALYAKVADPKGTLNQVASVAQNGGGSSYTVDFQVADTIPAGTYAATATVTVCTDAACSAPLPGRPLSVSYSVEVAGNTGLVPIRPWIGVGDWATFQGNIGHTAYVPVTLASLRFGKRWAWTSPLLNGYPRPIAAPVATNGVLYLNAGNTIQALSEFDAAPLWSYDVTSISLVLNDGAQAPAVFNGSVYFSGGHQNSTYLFALDAGSGVVQWRAQMSSQWEQCLAPIVVGTDVYTEGGTYGGLFGFDAAGNQLFFNYAEQTDRWSPAADLNYIYTYTGASGYGSFRQFDRRTGALLRTIQDSDFQFTSYRMNTAPVATGSDSVIGVNRFVALMRFNVTNGAISWRQPGNYVGNPAYAKGVLYAGNASPVRLEARDEASGALLWSWAPQAAAETSFVGNVIVTDNVAFVSTNVAVYAIDLTTHAPVWSYPKPGQMAVSSSGILYLATTDGYGQSDGNLIAFNLQ
jgi:outer membrane protein assembly factor BamB